MIPFNKVPFIGKETEYIEQAFKKGKLCGDGTFTKSCHEWLREHTGIKYAYLTTSCTHALEMAAILSDIHEGDEIIAPSYTFVSTVNAFVLRGARVVFVDIRPDTMNIDEKLIEAAVTPRTRAILPVHYGGVACEMDTICSIAKKHNLLVIEDAAQGVMAKYKGKALGTIGDMGAYSFHETKNYSMGEGGAFLTNNQTVAERAEIIREKGTNRSRFLRGQIDKYTWVDIGSSFLPSDMCAACLLAQLECADMINTDRLTSWQRYYERLESLKEKGRLDLPYIPKECMHNAHMFYIKVRDIEERTALIAFLKEKGIGTAFHYVPLHSSEAGRRYGRFCGEDRFTTTESERLLRLPMYYGLTETDVDYITDNIKAFFGGRK